jgi:hypothetical protein
VPCVFKYTWLIVRYNRIYHTPNTWPNPPAISPHSSPQTLHPKPSFTSHNYTAAPNSLALGLAFKTQQQEQSHATFEPLEGSSQSAMRGTKAYAMGLLLKPKERTTFAGSNIDDFVADAGQLLLLDAMERYQMR